MCLFASVMSVSVCVHIKMPVFAWEHVKNAHKDVIFLVVAHLYPALYEFICVHVE